MFRVTVRVRVSADGGCVVRVRVRVSAGGGCVVRVRVTWWVRG